MHRFKWLIAGGLLAATAACTQTAGYQPGYQAGYQPGYQSGYQTAPAPRYGYNPGYYNNNTYNSRRGPNGDYDRDGVPNRYDRDANGDGVPDRFQR